MKKSGLLFLVACFIILRAWGQQEPQFSLNIFNRLVINPGYAGSHDAICAGLIARKQWVGFVGAPQTAMLGIDAPVRLLHGGVGLSMFSDKLGLENNSGLKFAYAFRFAVGVGQLAIGASAGFLNKNLDGPRFKAIVGDGSDQVIPQTNVTDMAMILGAGIYYNTDLFYIGVSSSQLTESELQYKTVGYALPRHYYLMGGYNFRVAASLEIEPSFFVKTDASATPQVDVNCLAIYNHFFFGGFSYRLQDAAVALAGIQWNNFKFAYSYDINTSSLRGYNTGTHEIYLGYCFKLPEGKTAQRYRNVRFL